ncbi:fumarylacetoacetate hydrolase family protein [Phenylobacterium sp. VNQ135]|uniref:fumarylacetoacetate hydrolase family protein n=1 Tax=Phenylobacterium sp. VNQ135 TaxID=3400922 RepID=UPI003BFF815A
MKLATFIAGERTRVGLVGGRGVVDLTARDPAWVTLRDILERGELSLAAAHAGAVADFNFDEVRWAPVVPQPRRLFLILLNYEEDRISQGRPKLLYPHLMARFPDTQVGHGEPLVIPKATAEFDFEGEIAVILGRGGFAIPRENAMEHVAGYACYNDCAARDYMRHTRHFTAAKAFPASAGFGPWMTTADEIASVGDLKLTTRLNGEVYQTGAADGLTYPIDELIAYLSSWTRLHAGDVIATGSPGGAGHTRVPPRWLKPGDVVQVEVAGVGVLSNPFVAQAD